MNLAFSYFILYFKSTIRNTPALFFTLIFPVLLLLITAHMWESGSNNQLSAFVVFCNYSVQTVAFMLLGMGVSQEKTSEWSKYLRTLPVSISTMITGRLLHTLVLSLINLIIIGFVSVFILSIPLTINSYLYFVFIALIGAIPMAMIGMTIGYAANAESARTIFTLLNLLFLFASFSLPDHGLSSILRQGIPTYQLFVLSSINFTYNIHITAPIVTLVVWTLIFVYLFKKVYTKRTKK